MIQLLSCFNGHFAAFLKMISKDRTEKVPESKISLYCYRNENAKENRNPLSSIKKAGFSQYNFAKNPFAF